MSLQPLSRLPKPLLQAAHRLMPSFLPGKNYLRRAKTPLEERYFGNALIFSGAEKAKLLKNKRFLPPTTVTAPLFEEAAAYDDVQKMQYIDIHTWMTGDILVKADKMTMANSLELRVPYLDHHVFEFAATIPTKYKIQGQLTKIALRQAFAEVVPQSAVNRPKRGFPVPTRVWLRGKLGKEVAALLSDPALDEFFERGQVQKLIVDHRQNRADNSRKIWTLVIFALWRQQRIRKKRSKYCAFLMRWEVSQGWHLFWAGLKPALPRGVESKKFILWTKIVHFCYQS
jgi:asparagine synthase (glutamine-hydrolysing)